MWEERQLEFVPWDERTTLKFQRENSVRPSKRRKIPDFQTGDRGYFKAVASPTILTAPLHPGQPEFQHSWDRMMDRFGMALEICRLMSWKVHNSIKLHLQEAFDDEPVSPSFSRITWEQIRAAEKNNWEQLSEQLGTGVRGVPGVPPCRRSRPHDPQIVEGHAAPRA